MYWPLMVDQVVAVFALTRHKHDAKLPMIGKWSKNQNTMKVLSGGRRQKKMTFL